MGSFIINSMVKVRLNAKNVKPQLRGKTYKIIKCVGWHKPFSYLVENTGGKQYIFRGDELQTVFVDKNALCK